MKKFILSFSIALVSISAQAAVNLTPSAYSVTCTGADAQRLYTALKDAGATAVTRDNGYTFYSVDKIHSDNRSNVSLEPSDACYQKPIYSITFVDKNAQDKVVSLSMPPEGCPAQTLASEVTTALESIGADKVEDAAMGGEYGFDASSFMVSYNPKAQGDNQYYCMGVLGY